MCVWHRVCSMCVCLVDCSTKSSDIPTDSSELFTVPGLSESEKERKREVRWEGGGENHVRRLGWSEESGVQGVGLSVCLSEDAVCACMFWRGEVSACSPIITWWCVMKVRPVCGAKPYRFPTANHADTVLVCGLKHHPDIYTGSCSRTACSTLEWQPSWFPASSFNPTKSKSVSDLFVIQEQWLKLRWKGFYFEE